MKITDKITALSGVAAKRAALYNKLGIENVGDLIAHYPKDYIDYSETVKIADAPVNEQSVIKGFVTQKIPAARIRQGLVIYKVIVDDGSDSLTVVLYNNRFAYEALEKDKEYRLFGRVTGGFTRKEMNTPQIIPAEETRLIRPKYSLTEGLTAQMVITNMTEALRSVSEQIEEFIPDEIRQRYELCTEEYACRNIHFPESSHAAEISRRRLGFDELLMIQCAMGMMRAGRKEAAGCPMKMKDIAEFEASLPFELTGAQRKACREIFSDMCGQTPMNRLVQGDVGSGKTAVAAAACWLAAENGCQSALMAPTEILARQHYATLKSFLEPLGINVGCLTGSMTAKQKNEIKAQLLSGEINVITGTHALISESTEFKRLGLVITDEQHRFGVNQRKLFAMKGEKPHKLVMSATPIPRTLSLIIYGDLDISIINELPKGRQPVETYAVTGKLRSRALGFVKKELDAGRQGYIVCPMIEESDGAGELQAAKAYAERIAEGELKGYSIGLLHGKMLPAEKDAVMADFKDGKIQLLVSTTVIEVGVDVPNATVIMIESSDRFGLSQLHQLRGRVGRGKYKSSCILITDNATEETRARLRIMSSLHDGFAIAEEDLKIRGGGDFFGSRQSGLPPLKIADLYNDRELLGDTSQAAKELFAASPDLSEYPKLKEKALALLNENGSEGMN
ncbi:MAG: ATP-dependent DNA helicase RecG [Oscillospiraceae bacterium]|nr:ATP-dependent DNA helicase RecG [Oscillospiraceae bacterium]